MENSNKIPDFGKIAHQIVSRAPRVAGVEAVKFFRDSFVRGGFLDRSLQPWQPARSPLAGKRTLFATGNLMRSIRPRTVDKSGVTIESDTPYSALQNDGGVVTVTEQMKKYWWAQYYKHAGKLKKTTRGRISQAKDNLRENRKAAFCRAMALRRVGSQIKIPAHQFIGESHTLMSNLEKWVDMQIQINAPGR